jgi:hypothetical protein
MWRREPRTRGEVLDMFRLRLGSLLRLKRSKDYEWVDEEGERFVKDYAT